MLLLRHNKGIFQGATMPPLQPITHANSTILALFNYDFPSVYYLL